jgi:hypothetical protein
MLLSKWMLKFKECNAPVPRRIDTGQAGTTWSLMWRVTDLMVMGSWAIPSVVSSSLPMPMT